MDNDVRRDTAAAASAWLGQFEKALTERDHDLFDRLFLPDASWRDLVSFTWNLRQAHDREAMADLMWSVVEEIQPSGFRLDDSKPGPDFLPYGDPAPLEVFFAFDTAAGFATGLITLAPDAAAATGFRGQMMLTQLVGLREVAPKWPQTSRFDVEHPDTRWVDYRDAERTFRDRNPEVLVVGGGQHGCMTAAHLARLGVDALIIDKHPRVGDAWRTRYESLILHQPHGMLYFSFMRYPENFPEYIPKDKLADWFEAYVTSLDLNFWTGTEFLTGEYDEQTQTWEARVRSADGEIQVLHPKHLVIATGGSETPNIPYLEGLSDFAGSVKHSKEFRSGVEYAGKRVLVYGTGTSAHDLALDITRHGGSATLVQRNPVIIVDLGTANLLYGDYNGRQVATELIDTRYMAGLIYPVMQRNFQGFTVAGNEADQELHRGLEAAGMRLTSEPDETGWFMRYFRTGGGYYINVGASDAIISGDIKVIQAEEIQRLVANGAELPTGEVLEFDDVVLATGYRNQKTGLERYFGPEVAERVGDVWGFDAGGEINNGWKPTAQQGLWMMIGGIPQARWYSPLVALQIKAELDGVVPAAFKEPGHPTRTPALTPVG